MGRGGRDNQRNEKHEELVSTVVYALQKIFTFNFSGLIHLNTIHFLLFISSTKPLGWAFSFPSHRR